MLTSIGIWILYILNHKMLFFFSPFSQVNLKTHQEFVKTNCPGTPYTMKYSSSLAETAKSFLLHYFYGCSVQFSSVQFSHSVMSNSLWPHELQHTRPPCPSPTPRVHSDSRASSQWRHPAISSSVGPFSCPQSLPESESFPMSQLFAWGGPSTGVSALASFLPKKSQGWSPSEWTGWISLRSKGLSRVFSNITV